MAFTALVFAFMELVAFALPGLVSFVSPWAATAILVVYWAAHTAGGTAWYKLRKKERLG